MPEADRRERVGCDHLPAGLCLDERRDLVAATFEIRQHVTGMGCGGECEYANPRVGRGEGWLDGLRERVATGR